MINSFEGCMLWYLATNLVWGKNMAIVKYRSSAHVEFGHNYSNRGGGRPSGPMAKIRNGGRPQII